MSDNGQQSPNGAADTPTAPPSTEHLNIKVTDGNNEVFFKIKKSTKLEKLMKAFCERQGKDIRSARFLFEGQKVQAHDTPEQLEMADGDSIEVHQEQIGGSF
ncbi:hypothetical protein B0A52_02264 [Exophiala mesophila]|uniref:Ubiquitin-like domain-containing protein n=1 Tax=Exophiala mesophila TaxID=212818 RepID=A0A438NBZ8_EXOME|nr:hypothetical protein B0A52_02264 [Exophiala mesophila]